METQRRSEVKVHYIEAEVLIGGEAKIHRKWTKEMWENDLDHDCDFTVEQVGEHLHWYIKAEALDQHRKGCRLRVWEYEVDPVTGIQEPVGV